MFGINLSKKGLPFHYNEIKYNVEKFIEFSNKKNYIHFLPSITNEMKINVSGDYETIYPFFVAFEVTKKCPLRCKHCFNNSGEIKQEELDFNEIIEVLYKIKKMGVKKIMLTGGEPFSKFGIEKIIKVASSLFLGVSIGTNGYLITENIVEKIKGLNNVVFQVSVDGLEKTHDKIRGVEGSFKRAIKAIELLVKNNNLVIVSMTINNQNLGEAYQVASLVKDLGVKQIILAATMEVGRAKNAHLTDNMDTTIVEKLLNKIKEDLSDSRFFVRFGEEDNFLSNEDINCGNGDTQICIRENGDVSPCIHYKISYGNLKYESPKDIFHYKRVKGFRNYNRPNKECNDCLKCPGCVAYAVQMDIDDCEWKANNNKYIDFISDYKSIGDKKI